MRELERHRHLPDIDQLSILVATILLAYTLAHFIDLPVGDFSLQLPGIYLFIPISAQSLVAILIAALTAAGTDWLLRGHPFLSPQNSLSAGRRIEHWLLPALTAGVIGLPLFQLPFSLIWWVGFALGGMLFLLVVLAEYIAIDAEDVRHAPAATGLTAVAFALFLVLAAALRFSGLRLFLVLPTLSLAAWLVSLRALRLRLPGQWAFLSATAIALICAQTAAGLHYWPIAPVAFGLALLGPVYGLTHLLGSLAEEEPLRQAMIEPLAMLILIWIAAVWMQG